MTPLSPNATAAATLIACLAVCHAGAQAPPTPGDGGASVFLLPTNSAPFTAPAWRYAAGWMPEGLAPSAFTNTVPLAQSPHCLWLPGGPSYAVATTYRATGAIDLAVSWYSRASGYNGTAGAGVTLTPSVTFADGHTQTQPPITTAFRAFAGTNYVASLRTGDTLTLTWTSTGSAALGGVTLRNADIVPGGTARLRVDLAGNLTAPAGYRLQSAPTPRGPWTSEPAFRRTTPRYWRASKP